MNLQGTLLALGDDFGKIYIVHLSAKQTIVQTLHWHAHRVSTLKFVPNTPYLISGGEEAVLVQWHLETQSKQFISRIGAPILNFSLSGPSQTYYGTLMADNSVKIVRFDNNKVKVHIQGIQLDRVSLGAKDTEFIAGNFVVPHKNTLQMYSVDDRTVDSLQVKPRNFVSTVDQKESISTHVQSYCFTPNKLSLVTFEELSDSNSHKDFRI